MKTRIIHKDGTYTEEDFIPREPTLEEQKLLASQYLQDTDYKVIKCYEAQLQGLEMPYSLEALLKARQSARDTINK